MKAKGDIVDRILAGLIVFLVVMFVMVVRDTAQAYEPYIPREPTWAPPDIPQCNKDLFTRIKDGCNG